MEDGHLSLLTSGVVYVAYSLHALAFLAAVQRLALPALPDTTATAVGLPFPPARAALFVSGWRALPVTNDSGLETGGLVTGGAYRVSRNPQSVGWALLGVALVWRSGAKARLTALFWMTFYGYVPWEACLDAPMARRAGVTGNAPPRFVGWRAQGVTA